MTLTKSFFVVCFVLLLSGKQANAQAVVIQDSSGHRLNTWSARAENGTRLIGTWTAVPDTVNQTITGTWTIIDIQGRTLGAGIWSAAKSANEWTGSWRAVAEQHAGDYGGTWSAKINLKPNAQLADLFEQALAAVVGGRWWFGPHTGTWSVRAYK